MNGERSPGAVSEELYFNGINGDSGAYDLPPMTAEELAGFITGQSPPENLSELKFRQQAAKGPVPSAVKAGVDENELDQTGWGAILPFDADPAVEEALKPLFDLRHEQAGDFFHAYTGPDGYRTGEKKLDFLTRHGAGPGPADPENMPYYLLIVGSPEAIPYDFQYQLDVQYAVGRIHFNTLQEYANYAASVVAAERGQVKLPRRAVFFGVSSPGDRATEMSSEQLVKPLYDKLAPSPGWNTESILGADATKSRLARLLGGDQTPALLFSASHGMGFPLGSPRQLAHQGALLCSDWPGPNQFRGAIPQDYYFAGDDLGSDAGVEGLIAFFFACYGGGTPLLDEFSKQAFKQRSAIAPYPFLGRLPVRLLGHPRGGALAVIGHVERAWGYSFNWPGAGQQTAVFESTLRQLLGGYRIGAAAEYFNERYAELASDLSQELEDIDAGTKPDPYQLAGMWTANNDARGYAIIGDPAVRLPVAVEGQAEARPPIQVIQVAGVPKVDARPEPTSAGARSPGAVSGPTDEGGGSGPAQGKAGGGSPAGGGQPSPTGGKPPSAESQAPPAAAESRRSLGGVISMSPLPTIPEDYKARNPELYQAWVAHIEAGYRNNDEVFHKILNAFMRSHNSSVIMYWLLFGVGIGFFVTASVLAILKDQPVSAGVFGGLSIVAFLTYFISRPTQAIEENLQYITWLGVIYNSYWTSLAWSFDEHTAAEGLEKATAAANAQLKELIDRHSQSVASRPGFLDTLVKRE
jgi:hypothetical protein